MSFEAAIDRIGQIVQFQQQIFDPAAAASSSSSAAGGGEATSGSGTTAASSASFATALANAEATSDATAAGVDADGASDDLLGSSDVSLSADVAGLASALPTATAPTSVTVAAGAAATSAADPRVQAMIQEADSLIGRPYVWGGGHSGWGAQAGYDCSGFVSAVLHAGGYLSSPQDTTTLPTASGIEPGPGQYVTIYDRDEPGQEGHVIINIAGQFYESGGEAGAWGGGGGVEKIATPSAAYLATFNDVLHPAGL